MAGEDGLGVGDQTQRCFPIAKEPGDLLLQRIRIANLDGRVVRNQSLSECGKIFHMGTEEHRLAGKNRLDRILAAARGKTLADKYNRGDRIPMLKLAGCVEEETIGRRDAVRARLAAQTNLETKSFELRANLACPFHMTRRNDQSKRREVYSKTLKDFAENFLLASVRASAEEDRTVAINPKAAQDFERQVWIQPDVRGIVFDAADVMNSVARNSELDPAFHILAFLDADRIEAAKGRPNEKTKTAKARFRSFR